MHRKAEDASEGGGGVGSRSRVRDGKAWRKGVPLTESSSEQTLSMRSVASISASLSALNKSPRSTLLSSIVHSGVGGKKCVKRSRSFL